MYASNERQADELMIRLTKLNGEECIINNTQIEFVELIPEAKIIMMNKNFHIVCESPEEIINKIIEYNAKVYALHKRITVINDNIETDL